MHPLIAAGDSSVWLSLADVAKDVAVGLYLTFVTARYIQFSDLRHQAKTAVMRIQLSLSENFFVSASPDAHLFRKNLFREMESCALDLHSKQHQRATNVVLAIASTAAMVHFYACAKIAKTDPEWEKQDSPVRIDAAHRVWIEFSDYIFQNQESMERRIGSVGPNWLVILGVPFTPHISAFYQRLIGYLQGTGELKKN